MIGRTTRLLVAAAILTAASACSVSSPTKPSSTTPEGTQTAPQVTLAISTQPQSQTIASGERATLTVAGTGTGTMRYQWYAGESGTTSGPVTSETSSSFTTPALTATTSYWMRLSDA